LVAAIGRSALFVSLRCSDPIFAYARDFFSTNTIMPGLLKTITLGCKVNQYETEFVREGLLGIGYRDAVDEAADLCVVNTCTVTNEGDSKSRQAIRRLARENPQARIVVMGCYATRAPQEVAALPGVAEVVTDKRELPDLLGRFGVVDIPTGISRFGDRHRAYVKVQDGCLLRCSYCIIPSVRPQLYSRPRQHILDEVRRLLDNGYREIVLTGIHLGHYGVEWNTNRPKSDWIRLADLVSAIVEIAGDFRVRLSSIEATEVTRELIDVLADNRDRVCPHLHICLQSGSDRILRRMRRRWGTRQFLDCCRRVRDRLEEPAFTTDVIVGFPGETDEDFEQTCRVVREVGFSKVHIFPFSPRRGTPAAGMPDHVDGNVKAERVDRLAQLEATLRQQYLLRLVGRSLRVLVESPENGDPARWVGTSCRYAPVFLPASADASGRLVDVVPTGIVNGNLAVTA
jgi:threonylcarbamoyladenosine tRNA methylthiotransferase MtaB